MIDTAFGFAFNEGIEGDYLEFGVYRGRTFVEAWRASQRYGMREMQFLAFDSFSGLPEITGRDVGGPFQGGQFRSGRAEFDRALRRGGVDLARVHVVEGYYGETLSPGRRPIGRGQRPAAIAWVDCDLYESTVPVLDYLTDVLADGSVLIFDDWFCFKGKPGLGEQRACSEWLAVNPQLRLVEYRDFHWAGRSFIVNRSDSRA